MRVEFVAIETYDPVSARLLGNVQCLIGRAHQAIAMLNARVRPRGHAEARRALNRAALERECMRLNLFSHPFRERHRRIQHGAGQQQHELLSTIPAGAVDLTDFVAKDPGQLLEHGVAGLMAKGIIDALEPVEIAHHTGEWLIQTLGVLEHLIYAFLEMPSIIESGQHVSL